MELGGPGRTLKGCLWDAVGDANHPYDCFAYKSHRRSIREESMLAGFQVIWAPTPTSHTSGSVRCGRGS